MRYRYYENFLPTYVISIFIDRKSIDRTREKLTVCVKIISGFLLKSIKYSVSKENKRAKVP